MPLPPHLILEEDELEKRENIEKKKGKISLQWPSKYGAGGRRVAKAKGRKKK